MESRHIYDVFIAPQADIKLSTHMEFLARVSEHAAVRLYNEFAEALDFLRENPKACPLYIPNSPLDMELHYKIFSKRYRIVFEISDNAVYVYDVQDCRQNDDIYLE